MPVHWDWDWDLYHDPYWHWTTRLWPWDSVSYHTKCPTRRHHWMSTSLFDADFDVCTRDWHLHHHRGHGNPWCHRSCLASRVCIESGDEPDSGGKGSFKVVIDVHHFRADELVLKVRNNDTVVLEGKQADDRGELAVTCITREFTRKYKLPRNYDATQAKATLSADGILTIVVPAPPPLDDVERAVDIVETGAYFGSGPITATAKGAKAIENGDESGAEEESSGKGAKKKARINVDSEQK